MDSPEVYPNGISTSLPVDLQLRMVQTIPGLESAEIVRPGYAIEHDYVNPLQLRPTLETKVVREMWTHFAETAKVLVSCATTLRKAIDKLGTNLTEAMELAKQIDGFEGIVDEKYLQAKALLLKHSKKMDTATILLVKDLIEEMEHVADSCDDTADYVRILTVAREIL